MRQLMEDTDPCGCNHTNECSEFAPFPLPPSRRITPLLWPISPINRMQKAMMRKRRLRAALSFRCSTSRFWGKRGAAAYDAKRKTAPAPELRSVCALGASPIPGYPSKRYAALAMAKQYANMVSSLVEEYECKYGPLSPRCGSGAEWLRNPWHGTTA